MEEALAASAVDYSHFNPSFSTPGTPSISNANIPFNFDFPQIMPTTQQQQQLGMSAPAQQSAFQDPASAMEAFRRLQTAQAMQAAQYQADMDQQQQARQQQAQQQQQQQVQQQHQQQQQFQIKLQQMQMDLMKGMPYPNFVDPALLAQSVPTPSMFSPSVMNQVQLGQMQASLPFNTFHAPASLDALPAWTPTASAAPSPPSAHSTPDGGFSDDVTRSAQTSAAPSRSNSSANIVALAGNDSIAASAPAAPARTPGQPANADPNTPTSCINCKTTVSRDLDTCGLRLTPSFDRTLLSGAVMRTVSLYVMLANFSGNCMGQIDQCLSIIQ